MKDRYNDSKLIYVRVPSEGLDYVYNISTYWLRANPNETRHFGFNAVYSPTAKICVFNDFHENRAFTIPKEEIAEEEALDFYESESARTKFEDEDGDYYNGWGVTDNYDLIISLHRGTDYE